MIYYEDNFLPQDQFIALRDRVSRRFVATDKNKFAENSDEPVRLTYHGHSGEWIEGCNFLGHECTPAIEKIISTMQDLGIQELKNWSVWYQYIINTMTIPPHQDQGLRKSDQKNTYTAIIYTSHWEPGWGGEFIVGEPVYHAGQEGLASSKPYRLDNLTHIVEPLPNRMLIWSREEWHAVNTVTSPNSEYIRSFFGTGWSSIDIYENYKFDTGLKE
jgi:hypothetical protein